MNNKKKNVAIMMCCFNRKEKTRLCLESILQQIHENMNFDFDLYVYDDYSTDGTVEMIKSKYPQVILFEGRGGAYWCKSMHYLMRYTQNKYDYYLMVNDDVKFYQNAIQIMFRSYEKKGGNCGIVGACQSKITGEQTYGGRDGKGNIILPSMQLKKCIWANWNCFLIDKYVVDHVGIIDGKFQHAFGDFEYSNRMNKYGFEIFSSFDYVGECEVNSKEGTYVDKNVPRMIRLKKLLSPKGIPLYSYFRYNLKIYGMKGLPMSVYGYCSLIYYILAGKDMS